jgi:hypothetical protein
MLSVFELKTLIVGNVQQSIFPIEPIDLGFRDCLAPETGVESTKESKF